MAGGGREPGGILGLLELIEERPTAVAYDWRTRFHMGIEDLPEKMGWGEAVGHVRILRADPSSMIAAAIEGWTHPISREALILMDLYDLDMRVAVGGKKSPKPHPGRPYSMDVKSRERKGDAGGRSKAQVRDILNAHGHNLPV